MHQTEYLFCKSIHIPKQYTIKIGYNLVVMLLSELILEYSPFMGHIITMKVKIVHLFI